MTLDLDRLEALAKAAPQGKWEIWTSCSWRRIYADQGREKVRVIEPTTQHDRWPDLAFGPGVEAWMEGFTPEVALALIAEIRALRRQSLELLGVVIDVEQGGGFDDACLATIKRVMNILAGKEKA